MYVDGTDATLLQSLPAEFADIREELPGRHQTQLHVDKDPRQELREFAIGLKEKIPELQGLGGQGAGKDQSWWRTSGRRRGQAGVLLSLCFCVGLSLWDEYGPVPDVDRAALAKLLNDRVWVAYDPRELAGKLVDAKSISTDLRHIRNAGFTGIATFGCSPEQALIPRVAKQQRLAVIMGVFDAANRAELFRAIRSRNDVDAYCIGYNHLGGDYLLSDVRWAIDRVKRRTHRPATTTDLWSKYAPGSDISAVGDWLFPDVRISPRNADLRAGTLDPTHDVREFIAHIQGLADIAARLDKPIAFQAVGYPHSNFVGSDENLQSQFAAGAIDALRDAQLGAVYDRPIVWHTAFDDSRKQWAEGPFSPWDPYLGLISDTGERRPAVARILSRHSRNRPIPVDTNP